MRIVNDPSIEVKSEVRTRLVRRADVADKRASVEIMLCDEPQSSRALFDL